MTAAACPCAVRHLGEALLVEKFLREFPAHVNSHEAADAARHEVRKKSQPSASPNHQPL